MIDFRFQPRHALIGALAVLCACATAPPEPVVALQAAEQAIATADRARITDAASPELRDAREKLTAAQAAVRNEDLKDRMVIAERLAVESRADAELASAKTESAKARAVNDEIRQSTATLSQEMQRNSGVKP